MSFASLYHRMRGRASATALLRQAAEALERSRSLLSFHDTALSRRFLMHGQGLAAGKHGGDAHAQALAVCIEVIRRHTGLTLHVEQVAGSLALLQGAVAEMKTGEGKTLAVVPAAAMHAAQGRQVHVATANAYLARRDADALSAVYGALGLRVAASLPQQSTEAKRAAYAADIVYGPGSEFAFDWMRNMHALSVDEQLPLRFDAAIVDEADAVLIDDARTPMIVSRRAEGDPSVFPRLWHCVRQLREGVHFEVDRKRRQAAYTEAGYVALERAVQQAQLLSEPGQSLYAPANLALARLALAALQVHALYEKDKDYIVSGGQVLIVDAATGRAMAGRRWQDGIHEIIEAREGLEVQMPTEVTASISVQQFFAKYRRLSGLTGTALTEAEEFSELYGLPVVVVPTHRPVRRIDREDIVFASAQEKIEALAERAVVESRAGRPVLIGTGSVEESEAVSAALRRRGAAHAVLNARQNEDEAAKVAAAGTPGAITVSTNMAGRGTDIRLGRTAEERARVIALGGLLVLGASRNESERSDLQLRGRAGRQGDPGESQFYVSLEDPLLRDFGAAPLVRAFSLLGGAPGHPLSHRRISKLVRAAQQRKSRMAYEARLNSARLDGVVDTQRQAYYALRQRLLAADASTWHHAQALATQAASSHLLTLFAQLPRTATALQLKRVVSEALGVNAPVVAMREHEQLSLAGIAQRCAAQAAQDAFSTDGARQRLLQILDEHFIGLMAQMDSLKEGAPLAGLAARDPQTAFAQSVAAAFADFLQTALLEFVRAARSPLTAPAAGAAETAADKVLEQMRRRFIGRNEACPCGSGVRFRQCHGRVGMAGFLQYG